MKLILNKGQQLWFISDTHYNHSNICSATTKWKDVERLTRKFDSLEAMNDRLVDSINECVMPDDILIHLGDWSFGGIENIAEFRARLNCNNIHLVLGNHDHHIQRNKNNTQALFSSVNDYMHLDLRVPKGKHVDRYTFVLMHYPITSWNNMNEGAIHLHGHVHLPPYQRIADGKAMDVGVDGNGLEPISLDEVLQLLKNQPIKKLCLPKDHHEARI
jgi:calcineurin-like phosphoesterase family protein